MLLSIAGIALIVLKLTGVITWSWWWVLSPMWISATLLALLASGLVIAMIVAHWHLRRQRRRFTDHSV
jgi:membrane protein YdbS with pleckstrin-like domain